MNFVFLTEININRLEGATALRIVELSRLLSQDGANNVHIASLYADNSHFRKKKQLEIGISVIGKEKNIIRPYFLRKYFSHKEKIGEINNLCRIFNKRTSETIFIVYNFLSSYYDEIKCIKIIKKNGFKIIAEKNELCAGIALNQNVGRGWRAIPSAAIKTINILNGFLVDNLLRNYNGVIVISTFLDRIAKRKKVKSIRIPILHPIVITNHTNVRSPTNYNIGYFGRISFKRDQLKEIILAINILRNQYNHINVRLTITGPGNNDILKKLSALITKEGLSENVRYLGVIEQHALDKLQSTQDLLIVLRNKSLQGKASFPTKLAYYMHYGHVVLTNVMSDINLYVVDSENGFIIKSTSPKNIASKINDIIRFNEYDLQNIRENARITARTFFSYQNYHNELNNFIQEIMK